MAKCVIISSRPMTRAMRLYIPEDAFVIAADAGWQRAQEIGIAPHLVLGDFDSAPPPEAAPEILRLPAEKNDTDTYFAAKEAVRRGFAEVTILGGSGGRPDHTLANYATLLYLAKCSVACLQADENSEIRCIGPGTLRLQQRPACYLSVFPMGGAAAGVTLRGVKYPLQEARLTPDYPVGTSNEFAAPWAEISVQRGYLLVVVTDKDETG